MNYLLSINNLPVSFQNDISRCSENITLRQLRGMGLTGWIRKMLSLKADCLYIVLEDEEERALLPILKAVACMATAQEKFLVMPDRSKVSLTVGDAVSSGIGFLQATIAGQMAKRRAWKEVRELKNRPLDKVNWTGTKSLFYFKTNLWFGVKAGGSVGHVAGVVNALSNEGFTVHFLSGDRPLMVDKFANYHPVKPPETYGLPMETNYYRYHFDFVRQFEESALPRPGFIYQRLASCNYAGPVLARRLNVPLVMEYNGSEVWIAKNWGRPFTYHDLALGAEEVCLQHAHLVVVVSDVLKEELLSRGIPEHRIVSYPNCIDPEIFNPAKYNTETNLALRVKYGISKDAVVVTFVGTFGRWHGVDVLARAIKQMVDNEREWLEDNRVHFLLVGDGLHMATVKEELADPRYAEFFTLTGLVPQMEAPAYLSTSDILVSPHIPNDDGTRFFGSPTKLFEYMAMGKGIVASDLEQIGEVLRGGINAGNLESTEDPGQAPAVLTTPGSVDDLVKGIKFLAERPLYCAKIGQNARSVVLSRYTWKHHVQAILKQLEFSLKTEFGGAP